jgi:hypothetical protein
MAVIESNESAPPAQPGHLRFISFIRLVLLRVVYLPP